jgi:hypothetical protein
MQPCVAHFNGFTNYCICKMKMATNITESPYIFLYKINNTLISENRWEIPVFPNWYTNYIMHMHQITL